MLIPTILIICQFCICGFTYWLKSICNPKTNPWSFFTIIPGHIHTQSSEKSESSKCSHPLPGSNKVLLRLVLSAGLQRRPRDGDSEGSTVKYKTLALWPLPQGLNVSSGTDIGWSRHTSKPTFSSRKSKQVESTRMNCFRD